MSRLTNPEISIIIIITVLFASSFHLHYVHQFSARDLAIANTTSIKKIWLKIINSDFVKCYKGHLFTRTSSTLSLKVT